MFELFTFAPFSWNQLEILLCTDRSPSEETERRFFKQPGERGSYEDFAILTEGKKQEA